MTDTPADELRAAAKLLRGRAAIAQDSVSTDNYWSSYNPATAWHDGITNGFGGPTSPYITLMPPPVGHLIADWLEAEAQRETYTLAEFGYRSATKQAIATARAILASRDS